MLPDISSLLSADQAIVTHSDNTKVSKLASQTFSLQPNFTNEKKKMFIFSSILNPAVDVYVYELVPGSVSLDFEDVTVGTNS